MVISEFQCEHYIDPQPEEGDSKCFGFPITANEKYLAIGDTGSDRVVIYQRSSQQQWVRFRTVSLPTRPSILDERTTYKLALTRDTLVVVVVNRKMDFQEDEQEFYPFQPPERKGQTVYPGYRALGKIGYSGAVYRILVNVNSPLERIDQIKSEELPGFDVAVHDDKIAFAVATYDNLGQYSGYTSLITDGNRYVFAASGKIALNSNLLVIGSNFHDRQSEMSIFDLTTPKAPPQKVSIPTPILEIALTEKIIAIAGKTRAHYYSDSKVSQTLLMSIPDLSITPLEGIGSISILENRLIRYYSTTPDYEVMGQIEIFDISRSPPTLISNNSADICFGILAADLLITIIKQHNSNVHRICVSRYV